VCDVSLRRNSSLGRRTVNVAITVDAEVVRVRNVAMEINDMCNVGESKWPLVAAASFAPFPLQFSADILDTCTVTNGYRGM
jgi:hypothetical protein